MADDVTVNNGSSPPYSVASDDDGSGNQIQLVKLAQSADGSRSPVAADADGMLVNLGVNNDVTVAGVATAALQSSVGATAHADAVAIIAAIQGDTDTLPTGAATSALQTSVGSTAHSDAVAIIAAINGPTALPLPAGAATAAKQDTLHTDLASIDAHVDGIEGLLGTTNSSLATIAGQAPQTNALTDTQLRATPVPVSGTVTITDGSGPVTVDGTVAVAGSVAVTGGLTDTQLRASAVPVSAASLPLPTGAATAAKQPAIGTAGTPSTDVLTVQGRASMTPITVDGSGVIQPVSAAALPLPTGAATVAKQPALGTAGVASTDVITVQGIASGVAQPVSDGGGSLTVDGSVTVTQATGTNLHAVVDSGTITTVTNVVHVDDNAGSLTVDGTVAISGTVAVTDSAGSLTIDAPVGTPAFVRLSDGSSAIATLPVSLATAPALVAGTAVIGKVGIDQTTPGTTNLVALAANQSVNQAQVAGTTIDTNSGNKSAGTQRMVIATDQPNLTTALNVALAANQSVNVAQVNGVTAQTGTGVAGTGSQRVAVASDSSIVLAAGAATIGALTANQSVNVAQMNGVATTMGNGVAGTGVQRVAIASDNTAFTVNLGTGGTGGTSLGKAEDAAAASGDTGVFVLGVSRAAPASQNNGAGDYGEFPLSINNGLFVAPTPMQVATVLTPTIDTAAYATGDRLGSVITVPAASASGRGGQVIGAVLVDKAKQSAALELWLFKVAPTLVNADNGAFDINDANLLTALYVGKVDFAAADYATTSSNSVCMGTVKGGPVFIPYVTSGSANLFGIFVSRGTPTYAATSDLVVEISVQQF